ncbi:hypothetical protein TW85_06625 [Marinomonas sp. S3726]|uniref:hypothetical protein n=1 Tax=Marinomonas sp. S3726 TaxID=579484 RepID=UPI0005F9C0D0|nr:hypothetical protein [Marinomonas sp. S3726]KJZ15250.1 hypothetical protein TW85_06625 [Marinomonas sp. S3726]
MKKILFIALMLALPTTSTFAKQVNDAKVKSVYTHNCCNRGPYTAVVLEGGTYHGGGVCDARYNDHFAIETSHPNHDAFVSIALSANASGKKVFVYGNRGGCIGPFNRADGIAINND